MRLPLCTLLIIVPSLFHVTDSFTHPRFIRKNNCSKEQYEHAGLADGTRFIQRQFTVFSVSPFCEEVESRRDRHRCTSCPTLVTDCHFDEWYEFCDDVDKIMEGLVSPAPESFRVLHSVISKINSGRGWLGENLPGENCASTLDDLRALSSFLVKPDYAIELYSDAKKLKWRLTPRANCNVSVIYPCDCILGSQTELYNVFSTLQLSRMALDLATKTPNDPQIMCKIHDVAQQAQKRLALTMGTDLRGTTSSDSSFNFALAGVQHSSSLFQQLICIGIHELNRSGHRASFHPKTILHMVEKFAVCDIRGQQTVDLFHIAGVCLEKKGYNDARLIQSLKDGSFAFHYDRPLIWLWRFSSRQKKIALSEFLSKFKDRGVDWGEIFHDASRPLVCDVGSGMGASLLNLSVLKSIEDSAKDNSYLDDGELQIPWSECNYVGADLNQAMARFGNGIISRDKARRIGKVQFLCLSAEDFLTELRSYPGRLSLIMINFPSPYRLYGTGNPQLPSKHPNQFMVTKKVLTSIAELLGSKGVFLFQTKCEDVAVHVKIECLESGRMECIPCLNPIEDINLHYQKIGKRPKRVDEWLKVVPSTERAEGRIYSRKSLLPTAGRPETEVQCSHDSTVVHRFLFRGKLTVGAAD